MSNAYDSLVVQSHKGPYEISFSFQGTNEFLKRLTKNSVPIVDSNVMNIYGQVLGEFFEGRAPLLVESKEETKELRSIADLAEQLLQAGVRRGDLLVAIGGGVVQDITCFLASTLYRGLPWSFVPTTLLAQADSCAGSKSSVNLGPFKNILGTFTPPQAIHIDLAFHASLPAREIASGIGEMFKVHALAGPERLRSLCGDVERLSTDQSLMMNYIRNSLEIKRTFIEQDEFDKGPRNLLNYGHSFGHAIESATNFEIPHGIAVTLGLDMANFIAAQIGLGDSEYFKEFHPAFRKNYAAFVNVEIPRNQFFSALQRDKKNTKDALTLILPNAEGQVQKTQIPLDERFIAICSDFLSFELAH